MIHIVETFGERFKTIETYGVMQLISIRYAQYHEVRDGFPAEVSDKCDLCLYVLRRCRHQQPNGTDRWGTQVKEMDTVEENYFNGDEDDEDVSSDLFPIEEVNSVKTFELKRRRPDEDDGDDELSQIAQRSQHQKGTLSYDLLLKTASPEQSSTSKILKSSPSSSPSPPPEKGPREKRQRESDDVEDDIERLPRSNKRVISPTDVKHKHPRGQLNVGRKIAISIGKK